MDVFADVLRGASVSVGTPQVTERYLVSDKTTNKKMKERERERKRRRRRKEKKKRKKKRKRRRRRRK